MNPELPPNVAVFQMIQGAWVSQAIYVAAKLGLADQLAKGPRTADELARAVGAHAGALYRLLRGLASVGVFREVEGGRFESTPLADCLRTGPASLRSVAVMMGEEHFRAWGELLHSVKTGEPAFDHVYGKDVFSFYRENPGPFATFNDAMTSIVTATYTAAVAAYDFSGAKKVVDVGGGHGALMTKILAVAPGAKGVVYDQPPVIAGTREKLAKAGLASRCEALGGDFFESVPAGGDVYVLSHIVHDWDDARAQKILANVRKAMASGGRVVLFEQVIPPGNDPSPGKWLDLNMLVMCPGGRERTEAEFRSLFAGAGLALRRIVPTQTTASVIEAVGA